MASKRHTVTLSEAGQNDVPELSIAPGLLTSLFFGASLRVAGAEVEERAAFLANDGAGGCTPACAISFRHGWSEAEAACALRGRHAPGERGFLAGAGSHSYRGSSGRRGTASAFGGEPRARNRSGAHKTQQCQAELAQARQQSQGLTSLFAMELLDTTGITVRKIQPDIDFIQSPEAPIRFRKVSTYRAAGVVAVELWVTSHSRRPWTVARAELVDRRGVRLRVVAGMAARGLDSWQTKAAGGG